MSSYLFVFGRTPKLALLELLSFFPDAVPVTDAIARVEAADEQEVMRAVDLLGGTVKIARYEVTAPTVSAETLLPFIDSGMKHIVFGLSLYGSVPVQTRSLIREMKTILVARGLDASYVEPQHEHALSTVVVEKKHVQELLLIKAVDGILVGKTIAVQPFEAWGGRDYGRPHADPKAGMLPPKAARMVVNIALRYAQGVSSSTGSKPVVLDPFCGMGTVLAEALMRGCQVLGMDVSKQVVQKAHENLRWLMTHERATGAIDRMLVGDAVHASDFLGGQVVDAIVTEPYMGTTDVARDRSVTPEKVKNTIKGLEKLYIGCLRDWAKILRPGGVVVIALPAYDVFGKTYFVKKVVDMCENLGYTIEEGPIDYSREQAVVRREFYILRKKI